MTRFLIRLLINAIALYVALQVVPGIESQSVDVISIIWLALIFGFINAILGPILKFLTCPLILLTLGLFTLIINTGLFWLAGIVGEYFGVGFSVNGFMPAFIGALIVSIVSIILSLVFHDELKKR